MEIYPEAKVILTVRDPVSWYKSVKGTLFKGGHEANSFPINIMTYFTGTRKLFKMVKNCQWEKGNRLNEGKQLYRILES